MKLCGHSLLWPSIVPVYKHTYTHNNYTFSIHTFTHTLGTYLINININVACWQPYLESRAAPAGSSRLRAKLTDGRACSHAISLSKLQDIWRLFDSPRRSSPTLQPPPYIWWQQATNTQLLQAWCSTQQQRTMPEAPRRRHFSAPRRPSPTA